MSKQLSRVVVLAAMISGLSFGVAEARVARHVQQQVTTTAHEVSYRDEAATADRQIIAAPMCEESRMQVPQIGGGISWVPVESCDQD